MSEIDLVIPAYNEAGRLGPTLTALNLFRREFARSVRVVVVDNASDDETARVATDHLDLERGDLVIACAERGKGAAVRAGFAVTTAPIVGFIDADGATELGALHQVIGGLEAGHPVVVGSRRCEGSRCVDDHGRLRRWGAAAFRVAARTVVPAVADTQCGFKFFDGAVGRTLLAETSMQGFAFDVEVLAAADRHGLDVLELPVVWHAVAGSTFKPLRDGPTVAKDLCVVWWAKRRRTEKTQVIERSVAVSR